SLVLVAAVIVLMSAFTMVVAGDFVPVGRMDVNKAQQIADSTDDPLVAADALNEAWLNEEALKRLVGSGRTDAEVLWRESRSRVNIGENFEEKDEHAEPYFIQALGEAEKAVEMAPENADANLMIAISAGRVALMRGPFKAPGLVKKAFAAAHLATSLSDSIPVAYYVIGRTHKKLMEKPYIVRKLAGLNFASADSIPIYFEKALEISHGNMIQCHVEYADYLLTERKDKDAARKQLEAALALPIRDEQDPKAIERAKKMMAGM
ncbi:MAG: hypothetical protein V2A56_06345, partial [bacterium]